MSCLIRQAIFIYIDRFIFSTLLHFRTRFILVLHLRPVQYDITKKQVGKAKYDFARHGYYYYVCTVLLISFGYYDVTRQINMEDVIFTIGFVEFSIDGFSNQRYNLTWNRY